MLTVWGRTNSSNVMKVMWLLAELGLPYERVDTGGEFGGTDTAHYRAMSPFGLVPVVRDGATTVFESNTILRYLCRTSSQGAALYPAEPGVSAAVEAWMDAQLAACQPALSIVFWGLIRTPPDRRDDAAIAEAAQRSAAFWSVLEQTLRRTPFLAGDTLTLADIVYGPSVHRWFALPLQRPELPRLRQWYEGMLARPAYAATCATPLT